MTTIKEAIIVEGKDDIDAVNRAVDALVIATHGYGIKTETWKLIEKAYSEKGIIVFTDPDHAGMEIRRKILEKFPNAKEAFLTKGEALKKGDIGIENARPEDILAALEKAKAVRIDAKATFTESDMDEAGLAGGEGASARREAVGKILGIGYSNVKTFIKRLNQFGITKEEFYGAVRKANDK